MKEFFKYLNKKKSRLLELILFTSLPITMGIIVVATDLFSSDFMGGILISISILGFLIGNILITIKGYRNYKDRKNT
jgi:hypothetical protein